MMLNPPPPVYPMPPPGPPHFVPPDPLMHPPPGPPPPGPAPMPIPPFPETRPPRAVAYNNRGNIDETYLTPMQRVHRKKIHSGFYTYHDVETGANSVQCCTCCIGCYRRFSSKISCFESILSCPVYFTIFVWIPFVIICIVIFIILVLYASRVIRG